MGAILCCCTRKQRDKADTELYKQLLLKSSEIKLTKALDVKSILRTNKYLKLLLHSVLSKQGRFLIRNQHSQLLRIQSQIFTDSEENEELTLSEPDNDIGENLDLLEDFAPRDRAERTLLKGLLQKPKEISNLASEKLQQVSSLASLQDSKEKEKKSLAKKEKRSLTKKKTRLVKRSNTHQNRKSKPIPVMKSGSPRASDDLEPQGSQTISEQEDVVENGFVKVHDSRARKGEMIDSISLTNPDEIENQLDLGSASRKASLKHMRSGSLPQLRQTAEGNFRETDTKAGGADWEDPYQHTINTKLTQLRIQQSPMLDAASDNGSVVELNKLS